MAKLVLIRHGESVWNKKGLWTGWYDVPLSRKGTREAKSAAAVIKDLNFDLSFTSDLIRASDTLKIIMRELNILRQVPVVKHRALKERHYGEFAGKNKWEIKKEVGGRKFLKIRRGWNEPITGGESLKDVFARVVPYFKENIFPHLSIGKNVLLVAHGNSIRALIKHLEGMSDEEIEGVEIKTGEVLLYELNKAGTIVNKERRRS